ITTLVPPIRLWFNWRLEGLEHVPKEGPVLVAANHISYFDPLGHGVFLLKAGRRPRFLTKVELYKNPLLRRVLEGSSMIPVRRGSGDRAPVESALDALKKGRVVLVYPESTVTTNEDFSPMRGKTGIARLSLAARVPVLPIAIWGSQQVWQRSGARSLKFGRPIWVKAGTPLDFSEFENDPDDRRAVDAVTQRVMDELAVLVEDLRSRYPKRWS
ncbi:MAG TPA: lysophospholipid acyltransferase family protein, partial [Actinomycetota bacterium]|nr:lysophospholipid acyltransferase family protein [Actinomycetota bacterium]